MKVSYKERVEHLGQKSVREEGLLKSAREEGLLKSVRKEGLLKSVTIWIDFNESVKERNISTGDSF